MPAFTSECNSVENAGTKHTKYVCGHGFGQSKGAYTQEPLSLKQQPELIIPDWIIRCVSIMFKEQIKYFTSLMRTSL